MKCTTCGLNSIKHGRSPIGKQRFRCNSCGKTFQVEYTNQACKPSMSSKVIALLKEGCGIRSNSRLLRMSATTVIRRILLLAKQIKKPAISKFGIYEMDELCTYVGNKRNTVWIAYAIHRSSKQIADFRAGNRTKRTLRGVIETLLLANSKRIYTDKLRHYPFIIPKEIHATYSRCTNHIERHNLTLRHQLRRLQRRTLCYSKSVVMLRACLTNVLWG